MKRARVLLWALGALMCGILLFARLTDVFDHDGQPISQSVAPTSPHVQEAARLAATEVASQQPAQPDVLHLDPSAQNSSHAIVPKTEQPAASASPATETKSPAAADPIEVSPTQAPKDEFVMLTATATIRNGPSDSADIIGRAQHWTGRWKTRERPIRQTSRGKPPKQNTIERTTIMAAGGSPSDFSSGASCVEGRCRVGADRSIEAHKVCF